MAPQRKDSASFFEAIAWEMVGLDTTEWTPLNSKVKHKILVLINFATHYKAAKRLRTMDLYKQENENTTEILEGIFEFWLSSKPKMTILVPDNAKSMVSAQARTTLSDLNIQIEAPPAKESWSHGLMERAVQEVKTVASKTTLSFPSLSANAILALSIQSLNATEIVQGYTPHQWVYGKPFSFSDEDERSMQQILPDVPGQDFISILTNRQQAEEIAKGEIPLDLEQAQRLRNSKVRQPLQVLQPMDLVKIWRRYSTNEVAFASLAILNGLGLAVWSSMKSFMGKGLKKKEDTSCGSTWPGLCTAVQCTQSAR